MGLGTSLSGAFALLVALAASAPSPAGLESDLTILLDNNLQGATSPTADSGVIVLSPRAYQDAVAGCQALSEELWSPELGTASIQPNLDYLVYEGRAESDSTFWIAAQSNHQTRALSASGNVTPAEPAQELSVLCTQTAPFASSASTDTSAAWQVSVRSNNEELVGFRDRTSFRFYGVRYAPQPERFTYSVPYTGSNSSVPATSFGPECAQGTAGSEDCLFLNIWTPFLPGPDSKSDKSALKPVVFWIHGGALLSGTGNDNTFDGGSLASRGDVVLVAINYRLSTLGYLALDDGVTNGNFGLGDQINALDWVRANIQDFGGDPDRVTIMGQSAGAGSVRAIMASPQAEGKFAGAIQMSNVGTLELGSTYSHYYTIAQEASEVAGPILDATNCTGAESQVDCLRAVPATTLLGLGTAARFLVVDGTYLTTENLTLTGPEAPYKLMMGLMKEDAGAMVSFPTTATNATEYLAANGYSIPQPTLDELFPLPAGGANETLDLYGVAARVATDSMFRCDAEATAAAGLGSGRYGSVYLYEFERSYQLTYYPGTDVCQPPATAARPRGDPALPYARCHSGELYLVFGNVAFQGLPARDAGDPPFERLALDSFASFARTYDPNPDPRFLAARRYGDTRAALARAGPWRPATRGDLTLRALAREPYQDPFRELRQCEALGLPLTYWG